MSTADKKNEGRVAGKVAVVTGAGSGIGRAAALRLAEQGAMVVLVDLVDGRSQEVEKEIQEQGGEAFFADTDVSDPARVERALKQAADKYGRIDILFANAGVNGTLAPIEHMEPEDWDTTLGINLKGTFLAAKYAIPHMKENGGSIVITSSINGSRKFTGFGMSAYSSSKAGQVAFAKMAALELAQYGIRVNAICPGAIETNIGENTHKTPEVDEITIPVKYPEGNQPLEQGPGKPEQVADLVLFLASDESSHISGTAIYIDGVESLL
ncbi:SDR family NAD(P)-dependent oxidoreductase [Paenibacillus sp. PAMC21692]|uniref:SDR family oxidoreductase n=1 Tax=Paenibacillus sp. PAMC21692 TaxID=2762320 RepID=UPI00164D36B6|nr:SDR family NAD(P)-dependent oxidoreductase [Paenibacillus sp. PAMC21692]QNK59488.1 SDR family oxidoreductase [Paenibacillus sp. PAMC21692]